MSFTAKTAFQPRMWNNRHNDLQNVAGEFGAMVSETWTPADCSAGMFCVKGDHLPHGGYKMTVAANGTGDIYICNPGDVQRGVIGTQLYAEGINTLGLALRPVVWRPTPRLSPARPMPSATATSRR